MTQPKRWLMYRGRPPMSGLLVAMFDGFPSPLPEQPAEAWQLYLRPRASAPVWLSFKLCAVGVAALKGNYWLGWSRRERRFNRFADSGRLYRGRPALCAEVHRAIEALSGEMVDPRVLPPSYEPVRSVFVRPSRAGLEPQRSAYELSN